MVLPPDVFPSVWLGIEGAIVLGRVRAIEIVQDEVERRDDEVTGWLKAQVGLVDPLDEDVQGATTEVLRQHPKLTAVGGKRNAADPFVIGLAVAREGIVVTEETFSGRLDKPRIPDACRAMGVPCMTLVEFVRDQGWTF